MLREFKKPLAIETIEVDVPRANEVRVKVSETLIQILIETLIKILNEKKSSKKIVHC